MVEYISLDAIWTRVRSHVQKLETSVKIYRDLAEKNGFDEVDIEKYLKYAIKTYI